MLTETQALAQLIRLTAPDADPPLTVDELTSCLQESARAKVWTANAVVAVGDRVVTGNGRTYRCILGGTSGSAFPLVIVTSDAYPITDGGARWRDAGPAHKEIYDVRGAAHRAWLLKAGKAAERITFSADNQRFELSNLQAQCLKMAAKYLPVVVA